MKILFALCLFVFGCGKAAEPVVHETSGDYWTCIYISYEFSPTTVQCGRK